MSDILIGKVFFKDIFAGLLLREPIGHCVFSYDSSYVAAGYPPISYTLPVRTEPHIYENGLHPFFDNLVAEGWLEKAQARLLGKREPSRLELLLAFGYDLIGAVSVISANPTELGSGLLNMDQPMDKALEGTQASISGVQAKLAVIEENGKYRPTHGQEFSTHIAKRFSETHTDLLENEYLTTLAFKALLPDDDVVEVKIGEVEEVGEALLVKRFDRKDGKRLHFEEFNQLLGRASSAKYVGSYKNMADFILQADGCLPTEVRTLYSRILAGILLGNTDMHFKNFAMFHTDAGLRLAPSYDQVATAFYGYDALALGMAGAKNFLITDLKLQQLYDLGRELALPVKVIEAVIVALGKNTEAACDVIAEAPKCNATLKDNLINLMRERWNGTFSSAGKTSSQKQ